MNYNYFPVNNNIQEYVFDPTDYGYTLIDNSEIKGRDAEYNAQAFVKMLEGKNNSFQKIIELNAGAALYLSKKAKDLKEGFDLAKYVINSQITKKFLEQLIKN